MALQLAQVLATAVVGLQAVVPTRVVAGWEIAVDLGKVAAAGALAGALWGKKHQQTEKMDDVSC